MNCDDLIIQAENKCRSALDNAGTYGNAKSICAVNAVYMLAVGFACLSRGKTKDAAHCMSKAAMYKSLALYYAEGK